MILVFFNPQSGDDTTANTSRLCLKAARPVRKDLLLVSTFPFDLIYHCDHNFPFFNIIEKAMGMEDAGITCGAVCVYPNRVAECVEALKR